MVESARTLVFIYGVYNPPAAVYYHLFLGTQWSPFALSKKPPHHTLERVERVGSLFQQLAVLQLLAHPLQGVERLVELHGHLHFGEFFADVVPEDVPQADGDVGAG